MRISFKCSIFGGVEVVFRFYFPLRTWVPLATWCNVTISLCEHRPLSGLDLGKGNILFSKGSSTFFVMLPLKFKGFSNILIYEFWPSNVFMRQIFKIQMFSNVAWIATSTLNLKKNGLTKRGNINCLFAIKLTSLGGNHFRCWSFWAKFVHFWHLWTIFENITTKIKIQSFYWIKFTKKKYCLDPESHSKVTNNGHFDNLKVKFKAGSCWDTRMHYIYFKGITVNWTKSLDWRVQT